MKNLIVTLISMLALTQVGMAQQRVVEKKFRADEDTRVELDLKFGETIHIQAWNKNEIAFKANVTINNGKLNDALELTFDKQTGKLHIASDFDKDQLKAGRREDCPQGEHSYSTYSWNGGDGSYVVCSEITYELFVPSDIALDVESISGNIELINIAGPIRAKSISGFVDLSWPGGQPALVDLKTISGEVYTDIDDLQLLNKKDHIPLVGYKINGKIAGGGPRVSLESISGNIYLRKAKS